MNVDALDKITYSQDDWNGWYRDIPLRFGDKEYTVGLLVQGEEEDGIAGVQRKAYRRFAAKWEDLLPLLLDELLRYYNEEERDSYGPDDEEESAAWWPEIETREAMLHAVTPEMIVVPQDYMQEDGRRVYLLFNRTWGGEDLDDNGVAVAFLNESVEEIGYKDIAF